MIPLFQSKWLTVILVLVVGWLGIGVWRIQQEKTQSDRDVANAQAKVEKLARDNEALKRVIEYLKNPEYLARQARAKLNFKLPDEEVVQVYPAESKPAAPASSSVGSNVRGTLEKIKDWWYHLVR